MTTARGRVVDVRHGATETVIELEVWSENDDGTTPTRGTATVAFPR